MVRSKPGMRAPGARPQRLSVLAVLSTLCLLALLSMPHPAGATPADGAPMTFTLVAAGPECPGCVVVNAKGEITDDTSRDFAMFLAETRLKGLLPKDPRRNMPPPANTPKVIVAFESVGGKVVPALVIGRRIRQLGWTTIVGRARLTQTGVVFDGAGCYSACSMVMLGGVERYVAPGSRPGVHQFSPQFKDEETFSAAEMNAIVRDYARQVVGVYDYVQEMGVDISFFVTTMRTPFTGMDVLPKELWTSIGLATGILPQADETPVAVLLDASSGTVASVPSPPPPAPMPPAAASVAADPAQKQVQTASLAAPRPDGIWTLNRDAGGTLEALFSDSSIRLTVACLRPNTARLELTFKALDPIELEHIRAAAFAAKRLGLGERHVAITSVSAPGRGEQGLAAMLDTHDLKALQGADALSFSVLDRAGRPAAHSASISAAGAARTIADAMARCGGV